MVIFFFRTPALSSSAIRLCMSSAFDGEIPSGDPESDLNYYCNVEEVLWLHAHKTSYNSLVMIMPDTDVYITGLGLHCSKNKDTIVQIPYHTRVHCSKRKDNIVQISPYHTKELRLLSLCNVIEALESDWPSALGMTLTLIYQ